VAGVACDFPSAFVDEVVVVSAEGAEVFVVGGSVVGVPFENVVGLGPAGAPAAGEAAALVAVADHFAELPGGEALGSAEVERVGAFAFGDGDQVAVTGEAAAVVAGEDCGVGVDEQSGAVGGAFAARQPGGGHFGEGVGVGLFEGSALTVLACSSSAARNRAAASSKRSASTWTPAPPSMS